MKPLSKLILTGSHPIYLVWKQPRFGADYFELSDDPVGDALYASLIWPKWLSDLAVAHSAVGIWHFDRLGWLRRTIIATRPVESAVNLGINDHPAAVRVASFEIGWLGEGDLILSSGNVFHWYRTKTFRNAWAMTEIIPNDTPQSVSAAIHSAEMDMKGKSTRIIRKPKILRLGRRPKPVCRERLVYEIEFGMCWFKQEAWIKLPTSQAANDSELIILLCAGMYLGYCYNQDSAAVVAVSSTAGVS